jgi:transcriptional regulator with XRE-family HTH domain
MMGRREKELPCGPLQPLARYLRNQRERAGLTYNEMVQRTGITNTTLSRAAGGKILPALETVTAYATVCGANPARAQAMWRSARRWMRWQRGERTTPGDYQRVVSPYQVDSPVSLAKALRHMRVLAGDPTLDELARRSGVATSTLADLLTGRYNRRRWATVQALVTACQGPNVDLTPWHYAWARANFPPLTGGASQHERLRQVLGSHGNGA